MKLIPKPVVDAQILAHCIGIYLSRLFDQLPTLGIVDDRMLMRVIWYFHKHLPINLSNVGSIKLGQVKGSVWTGICGAASHLQPFLIFDVLLTPPLSTRPLGATPLLAVADLP